MIYLNLIILKKQYGSYCHYYRTLNDNKIFYIKYKIKHIYSGTCKFSNQPIENLISKPFIDVSYIFYTDENNCRNVNDLFKNYIKYKYYLQ